MTCRGSGSSPQRAQYHDTQPPPTGATSLAQRRPCRLEPQPLAEATGWLERYQQIWEGNFRRLDAVLAELPASPTKRKRAKARRS